MSKVLKTVGAIASIAAMIPGPQQPFVAALAAAATIGAQLTAKPPAARGQVNDMILGANRPMPYLIGRSYSGGLQVHDVGYGGTVGKVENPHRFMPVVFSCCGPVESLESVQFDFADVPFTGTAATGYYAGFLWRDFQLGLRPEADALAPNTPGAPGWSSSHKLSSWAAIGFSFKWDKKSKRFAGGQLPTIGAIWEGVFAYDPRLDSTYPGGSGSHRIDDEDTWEYTRNPALHALAYSYGRTVNGVKVFGVDLGEAAIDVASAVAWANVCDANGWNVDGTIFEPGDKWNNLKRICEAGAGQPVLSGGMLRFDYQAPRTSLATISRVDLAQGPVAGKLGRGFKSRHNTIVPRFRSEDHQWTYQQAEAVTDAAFVTADGETKSDERQWDLVTDVDQVTELATYDLWQRREAGPFRVTCKSHMRIYAPGDCLTLASELGIHPSGAVKAVVRRRTVDPGSGTVSLELEQETDDKHTAALGATGSTGGTPTAPTSEDLDDAHFDNSTLPPEEVADEAEMIAHGGPPGSVVVRADTQETYQHNGGTSGTAADWTLIGTIYTDERAQDAIGAMVDSTLVYADGPPTLGRAALTGDVTASAGSNALTIANDAVTFAKFQNIATAKVLGRSTASTGDVEELGTTGTFGTVVLSASPTLTGTLSAAIVSISSYLAAAGGVQATGARTYAGAGLGLQYSGGTCFLQAFDHGGASYLPLTINGNPIHVGPSGTNVMLITTGGIVTTVTTYYPQGAGNAVNATATLTIAQLLARLIFTTSASAVSLTLPTGTLTDAGVVASLANDRAFEWCILNLGSASGAITMLAGTNHTYVGSATVAIGTSAQFWTRKTAANTYVTYRVA